MLHFVRRGCAVFMLIIAGGTMDVAATPIVSGGGTATCVLGPGTGAAPNTPCALQAITPHSLWQPNLPSIAGYGGVWVSYANTGVGGNTLAPQAGSTLNPTGRASIMDVSETFNLSNGGALDLYVWADDTADVFLDNVLQIAANFSQNVCANGSIGCEPGEYFHLNTLLGTGNHALTLRAYQTGSGTTPSSNPFGLLYSGNVTVNTLSQNLSVPAPDALVLMLTGLVGLLWRRSAGRAHSGD